MPPRKTDRICVVGAGPGGLSAAFFLEERGYEHVAVLEKSDQVAGKARTWWVDGTPIDLGALDVGKPDKLIRAMAAVVGQPLVRTAKLGILDLATGTVTSEISDLMKGVGKLRLGWLVLKYLYYTGIRYAPYLESPGMVGAPQDLTAPMSVWLDRHGLADLRPIFEYSCTNFGYGPLDEIPAAYLLRFIDLGDFLEVLDVDIGIDSWPKNFKNGYQSLWEGVAGRLRNVRTGVSIEGVRRHPMSADPVRVHIRGQPEAETFDHVIVACCLDSSIGDVLADIAPPTRELFDRVIVQPYTTTVCKVKGLPRLALSTIPLTSDGRTACLIKNWNQGEGSAFYVMNRDGETDEELFRNICNDMAGVGTVDGKPDEVTVEACVHQENWRYFPHVSSEDMANAFYEQLEALQGRFNTYFTGGLMGFETVHNTMRYSESLVQRFFPA